MRIFDSHAHVGAPELIVEAPELIARAREAGVQGMLAIGAGYGIGANAGAVMLAQENAGIWASVGIHPHDASEWSPIAETALEGWLAHSRVVAVGECGLDYWYENSPREAQVEALRAQIRIACNADRPLVIHVRPSRESRDAFDEILTIFDAGGAERVGGFDISFSGILTFKNASELRAVAAALPLERLLVETDTPLLAPVPHRGRRNEPAWVTHVVDCLAELHGKTPGEIAARTDERARALFRVGDGA